MNATAADLTATQDAAIALLRATRILPVVTAATAEQGVAIARALLAGGLTAIEVTLRTPAALDAIAAIKSEVPDIALGAGTVLDARQVAQARAAGASFLVTPGTPPDLARALAESGLPAVPGAATPGELIGLTNLGFRVAKLFPAAAIGGLALIRALQGPLGGLLLCPTGGIREADAAGYLAEKNVVAIGGSWMVAKEWIEAGHYREVERAARAAMTSASSIGN